MSAVVADGPPPAVLLRNANVLDPDRAAVTPGLSVLVEDGDIRAVGPSVAATGAREIDLAGRVVLPGLIDAHVHALAYTAALGPAGEESPSYVTARAADVLGGMLDRGFTTVRDAAGADFGLARAVEEGWIRGPRVLFCGKALSQTGGHGDHRPPGRDALQDGPCRPTHCRIADGTAAVRHAARDELRRGAHHIKIMAGGGVASPTDRIDSTQYSQSELEAAVEEAEAAGRYVAAHAYTSRAVVRALRAGVRSIEHGNLMDGEAAEEFAGTGAFYVPTLSTYAALAEEGPASGLPPASLDKVRHVLDAGLAALDTAHRGGVPIVFGTDLLGSGHGRQLGEFALRAQVQPIADVLRGATTTAARLLGLDGRVGRVAVGAHADLLVVDRDPLRHPDVLADLPRHLRLVLQGGRIDRDTLTGPGG